MHIYKNSRRHYKDIHRLVAETFISNPNNLPIVNHKDENPANCHMDNLEWCTYRYNSNYSDLYGEGMYNSKLTVEDIKNIIKEHKMGAKQYLLADKYKVGRPLIHKIINNKSWKKAVPR